MAGQQVFTDLFGHSIALPAARWRHVLARHQELKSFQHLIPATLLQPDAVVQSVYAADVRLYYKFFPGLWRGKHLVLVIHFGSRNEILTAYVTQRIKGGARVWPSS